METADFLGKKLLIITAHPDDESFMAAGTIHANRMAGGQTGLVCATLGERGKSHLQKPLDEQELKAVRKKELLNVAAYLGIFDLFTLDLPDCRVMDNQTVAFEEALRIAEDFQPRAVLGFGEDGISGHLDHIAIGSVARRIAEQISVPFYAFALPPALAHGAEEWQKNRRRQGKYRENLEYAAPNMKVAIDPQVKLQALRFYKSQIDEGNPFAGFPERAVGEFLKAEYFIAERNL